jgi:glycosyltransferase involved in cell wall biosynthesis
MINKIKCLNPNYSTIRLCYKLIDDKYLDENDKIKKEYKFTLNFPKFGIINSKIPAKRDEKFDTFLFLPKRKGEGDLRTKGYFKKSFDNKPLITIITIVYNGEEFLEETIKSVINQTYSNIEYIIIDGGSTDGTLDIIKKYEDYIDYWISEKDSGIYDAMNKGIDLANGDWINFMNGGDLFYNNESIEKIVYGMKDKENIYFGRGVVVSEKGSWIRPKQEIVSNNEIENFLKKETPIHQAVFFPKSFYKSEKFDLKYKILADDEHHMRAYKQRKYVFIDVIVCKFILGGVSSSFSRYKDVLQMSKETYSIGKKHNLLLKSFKRILIYHIKYLIKTILGENKLHTITKRMKE